MKCKIIEKRERDVSMSYNQSTSTICTILKNKDKIQEIDASREVRRIVEKLLFILINKKQLQGDTANEVICELAKVIFASSQMILADLVKKKPESSTAEEEVFKESRGWFEKY